MTTKVTDLSDIEAKLDDPAFQDEFRLARRFGAAVRVHFRGRRVDPEKVINAAIGAVQAAIRDVAEEDRRAVFDELRGRLDWFEEFLAGIGRLPEGEA